MKLSNRSVAVQGFGFGPTQIALQGLVPLGYLPPVAGVVRMGGAVRPISKRKPVADWAEDAYNLTRLHQDDQIVTELLLSLVTKGFFDG